jgi:glycosyltransferase involved in cell wall biosynthesis
VSDLELVDHLQTALAFIFPTNTEDFGIAPVEAMAAGTPVVAYGKGGPLDYVIPGKTGFLFNKLTVESVVKAIGAAQAKNFNNGAIAEHAQNFSVAVFRKNMKNVIQESLANTKK